MKKYAIIGLIVFLAFIFINNLPFILASADIRERILRNDVNNPIVENYIKEVAMIQVRDCTFGAKLISLECGEIVQKWALGKENYQHLQLLIHQNSQNQED